MINKFSIKYLNYRLHQLFYFQQIIKRKGFNFLIDKKIIPIYNLKGLITNFDNHELEEIYLINKYLYELNTLELGCSLGVSSLNIKKKIRDKKLISIDGNKKAIEYCLQNLKLNSKYEINFIHHIIFGENNFIINDENFLSSFSKITNSSSDEIKISCDFLNNIIINKEIKCLVIDVEGLEEILLHKLNLELIELIFVELHPAIYGKNNLKKIIQILNNHNFKIVENLNINFFFKKFLN